MLHALLTNNGKEYGLTVAPQRSLATAGLRGLLMVVLLMLSLAQVRAADAGGPNPNAPITLTGTIHVLPLGCGNPNYKGPESVLILIDEKTHEITELKGDVVDLKKIKLGSRVNVQGTLQAFDTQIGPRVLGFTAINSAGALEGQQAVTAETQNASDPVVAAAPTLTNLKCLLIFANTNDYTVPSSKITSAKNVLFNNSSNAANGMEHATYGHYKLILGDTAIVTLNVTANGMSYSTMWSNMKNAASSAGYNLSNYDRVLCFAPNGVNFNGAVAYGSKPGKDTIYASNATGTSMDIHLHELGHNFGFAHAGTGTNQYGDEYLAMGISHLNTGRTETYGAVKKFQAGWFNPFSGTQATLTTDATFDLYPVSQNPGSVPGMRIVRISGTNYYISYMKRGGSYEYMNATHAVTVHTHSSGATSWRKSAMQSAGNQYTAGTTKVRVERFGPSNSYATVSFDLEDGNTKPVANGQSVSLKQNTSKAITLTGSDADGDTLIFATVTNPTNGTLSGTAPNLTYTPTANYTGADSFVFKVNDGKISSFATVTINVVANSAPVANSQTIGTDLNTPVAITLTATDANNDPLTYTVLTPPSNGALSGTLPNLTYTPTNGYAGTDFFTFKANDGSVDSNTATITIKVANTAPTSNAGPDQSITLIDQAPIFVQDSGAQGLVSMEAENFHRNIAGATDQWIVRSESGASGGKAMDTNLDDNSVGVPPPQLSFDVQFNKTGTHYFWVRGRAYPRSGTAGNADSVHGGIDGVQVTSAQAIASFSGSYGWSRALMAGGNASINVTTAGVHSVEIFMREDGFLCDKIVLTKDSAYTPTGNGPAQSAVNGTQATATLDGTAGDIDGDTLTYTWTLVSGPGTVNFGDATAIDTTATFYVAGTYTLRLTVSDGLAQTTDDVVITVNDSSPTPSVTFTAANQSSVSESGTLTVTAQLSATSAQNVTVPFTVTGTATSGTDYTITASPITITAGATTGTATISILSDIVDEANETVVLTMGTPTNASKGATTVHTATITDDDATPTVTFTAAGQASVGESGTLLVTAQLTNASSQSVTVPFTVSGSATSGADYTITASPITIAAGALTGTATITIVTDTIDEPNETVILTMGTPTNATKGATTVHTATITDDDATPTVTFTAASQASANESGPMTVTAQLSGASSQNVSVPFTVTGTATSGTDYTITASPIVITAGATTGSATITIVTDTDIEGNETVILTMGTPTNAAKGATTVHTATIMDDDGTGTPSVAWTQASQSSPSESGTMTVTAQLSAASAQNITVPFTVSGTATSGMDYTITASPISIAAGATSGTATITIQTDSVDEPNETVVLTMGTPTNATAGATLVHTATITDDDATPSVTWTTVNQASTNESGTLTVTAQLSAASSQSVSVPFTVSGTATLVSDYTITTSPITIAAGATSGAATITIVGDTAIEGNETVVLTMGTPTNATKGATTVHTATITDDDGTGTPSVAWTVANQSSAGESGTLTVTAQLSAASAQTITVPFTVTGTATSGADYTITASPITISSGATTGTATITIISDTVDEPNETVILTIGTPTNATKGATTVHTATITDDDATPTVTFTVASQLSAGESGTMTVTAQLSNTSSQSVTVPFAVTGTAAMGADYTITTSPITIAAGATSGSATISIISDAIDEPNETVVLTMGTPTNATKGATTIHTATIIDDDATPTVTWATASQASANESGTMTVTAQLSAVSGQTVSVPFAVSGTATLGADYTITASPITIAAGATSGTATITIVNDSIIEGNETVILTMGTPTNATKGATTVHTATITDDDVEPAVTIIATDPDANETPGDPGVFTVQLSAAAASDITVNFVVSGSAISDTDYLSVGTSVIILAGQLSTTVTVEPIDDPKVEKPETVIVTLAAGTGYQIGTPDSDTVTIADNDKNDPKGNPNSSGYFEDGSSTSANCGVGSGLSAFLLSLFLMVRFASQQRMTTTRREQ